MKKLLILLVASGLNFMVQAQQPAAVESAEKALGKACLEGNADAIQAAAMALATSAAYAADKFEYASNLLSSVEVNGVLFTGGKGDTYPVIVLQFLKNMRTDVRVVHTDWLVDAAYFQRLQAATGIEKSGTAGIAALARKMPVYVSLAAKSDIISELESELYCTGLAFKCSAAPLANVRTMYAEWWKNCGKSQMASGYSLNANYLVPLAMLADYAKQTGQAQEYKNIKQKYAEVARSVGEKEQLPVIK